MAIHPFGYITAIILQQLMIVALFWGIIQLFQEQKHLRRLAKFQARRNSSNLNLAGHEPAGPWLQGLDPDLPAEPALERETHDLRSAQL